MNDALVKAQQPRARSISWHLGLICILLLLPSTAFFGWALWQYAATERSRLLQQGQDLTGNIGSAVEAELASFIGTARLAASSPRLVAGPLDPDATGQTAAAVARSLDVDIVIRDVIGRQLVNTRLSAGQDFRTRLLDIDQTVLATKQAAVSDLFLGSNSDDPLVAVVAPVIRPTTGEIIYLVDLTIPAVRIRETLLKQPLGEGLYATVLDRKGHVIARTRRHEQFVGTKATQFVQEVTGPEGVFKTTSLDGVPILVHYSRLKGSDWIIAVGLEEEALNAPVRRLILLLVLTGLCLALLSAILAVFFGKRITGALQELSCAANALGKGLPVTRLQTPIGEVNEVSAALANAAEERKRAEESQALMVRELHHRVKNTLTTVQAVVSSTARTAETIAEFREAVTERIMSLAKTHTLLVNNAWGGASLRDVLWAELEPYNAGQERIRLDGPEIHLPDTIALAFGMAVHELTMNAAKYGALSLPTGRVHVTWAVAEHDSGRCLALEWQEHDGPPVKPAMRWGFGSTLLERVLGRQLQGDVKIEYLPEGLRVRVHAPLALQPDASVDNGATALPF